VKGQVTGKVALIDPALLDEAPDSKEIYHMLNTATGSTWALLTNYQRKTPSKVFEHMLKQEIHVLARQ
jgi:hypothetical protein